MGMPGKGTGPRNLFDATRGYPNVPINWVSSIASGVLVQRKDAFVKEEALYSNEASRRLDGRRRSLPV